MAFSHCPFCDELIQTELAICPKCGKALRPPDTFLEEDEAVRPHGLTGLTYTPDWVGANLIGVDLQEAPMEGANLRGARLAEANMGRIHLSQADLSRADLSGARLHEADLSEAVLCRARLQGAELIRANLFKADLTRAELSGADLSRANLSGADCTGADLSCANLSESDLVQADFSKADLSGAILSGIRDWELIESVEGANLYGLREAPAGFLEWALTKGALSLSPEEWKTYLEGTPPGEPQLPETGVTGGELD